LTYGIPSPLIWGRRWNGRSHGPSRGGNAHRPALPRSGATLPVAETAGCRGLRPWLVPVFRDSLVHPSGCSAFFRAYPSLARRAFRVRRDGRLSTSPAHPSTGHPGHAAGLAPHHHEIGGPCMTAPDRPISARSSCTRPPMEGFDGGAGSRYSAGARSRSFWYPTWLAQRRHGPRLAPHRCSTEGLTPTTSGRSRRSTTSPSSTPGTVVPRTTCGLRKL